MTCLFLARLAATGALGLVWVAATAQQPPAASTSPAAQVATPTAETPGADKESNWLPSPAGNQMFYMILREYLPGPDLLKQTCMAPEVVRVK